MSSSESGQALVELLISSAAVALTLAGAGWVLHSEWQRARCAYAVFEAAHAKLYGKWKPGSGIEIRLEDGPDSVRGSGKCGGSRESVELARLEAAGLR